MQVEARQDSRVSEEQRSNKSNPENEIDLEMEECLSRLKEWQTENLMAPHGMDRFVSEDGRRTGGK